MKIATELIARSDGEQPTRRGKFAFAVNRCLDDFDLRDAIFASLLIALVYWHACFWHAVLGGPTLDASYNATIAEIVGAFAGILFAIVVFSVQLHAGRADGGALAVPYLIRTHRIFPLLSLAAGLTLANVGLTIAHDLFPAMPMTLAGILNAVCIPAMVLASLWLIAVTVRDSTSTSFEPTLSLFRRDMVFALSENQRRLRMNELLTEACRKNGFKHEWPQRAGEAVRDIATTKSGHVVDIRLDALANLAEFLQSVAPDAEGHLIVAIGQRDFRHAALKLAPHPDAKKPSREEMMSEPADSSSTQVDAGLDERAIRTIQKLLDAAIVTERIPKKEMLSARLDPLWEGYATLLQTLVADKRRHRLEQVLNQLSTITQDWSDIAPDAPLGRSLARLFQASDTVDGPLGNHVSDAIAAALRTGDQTVIEPFTSFLSGLALAASTRRLPHLLHEVGGLIQFTYFQMAKHDSLPNFRTDEFDEIAYHTIWDLAQGLALGEGEREGDGDADEEERADVRSRERETLEQAIWTILALTRFAMRFGHPADAGRFAHRLFEHEREGRRIPWRPHAPNEDTPQTLFDYVRMVLAGWVAASVEEDPTNEAARAAFPQEVGDRLRLMAVWELYDDDRSLERPIDTRLGITRWDPTEPEQHWPGAGNARMVDTHWIERGLHLLLLHAKTHGHVAREYFRAPPPRHTWQEQSSREWLERMAKLPGIGIDEPERNDRIEAVTELIRGRQVTGVIAYMVNAVESPIDSSIWGKFVSRVAEHRRADEAWIRALRAKGCPAQVCESVPQDSRAGVWVWRDFFIPGNNWVDGFSSHLGEQLAIREAVDLFGLAEERCQTGPQVKQLATIADDIRAAAQSLRPHYSPSIILLPQQDRFACALFDAPLWSLERDGQLGSAGIAEWEGMLVMRWPHTDATTVMLADAAAFFGSKEVQGDRIDVQVHDFDHDRRAEIVARFQEAERDGTLPSEDDLRILVEAYLKPSLGIADEHAGIKLSIEQSDASHAMSPHDDLYHRVTCPDIEHDDDLKIHLSTRLPEDKEDRSPCPVCEPEKMDREARRRNDKTAFPS